METQFSKVGALERAHHDIARATSALLAQQRTTQRLVDGCYDARQALHLLETMRCVLAAV
jgi:hypothetical protein